MQYIYQGTLFSNDFLNESIVRLADWLEIDDAGVDAFAVQVRAIFARFPTRQSPNESQTEDDAIWPILRALGWTNSLRQQNLAPRGREDVPDGLLFKDAAAKAQANRTGDEWRRYEFGLAVVESKRWNRPLDRRSGRNGEETAPSTQMLRYLRRVEDLTTGKLRWGFLTNGGRWRLYYQGARSVAEQFLEIDLAAILDIGDREGTLFTLTEAERKHWLRVFMLVFRRESFIGTPSDARTFHQRALDEGRFYEERVAANLSNLVFGEVFPQLARAIAAAAPAGVSLQEVREAALVLLYRLLFILYAEDRDLLPVHDRRYGDYGLRDKVRGDVGRRMDHNDTFSETAARYWAALDDLCRAIDEGDSSIGLPPYNGGLFERNRTPLLTRVRLSDTVMARVIDTLSFEQTPQGRHYINYRDLSVQQLGSIYERLLEHEVVQAGDTITIRPNVFARRASGSYYTPDELVGIIIRETVGPIVTRHAESFRTAVEEQGRSRRPEDQRLGILKRTDPAEKLLDLKICDPAMGSGHFLVSLVDYLADQVIAAMAEAEASVSWARYVSPLSDRIELIRNTILGNAEQRGWTVDAAQLDDRHIIRRMVLKRCVYGIDKNHMAVELAKVSLWLHTFTVGAPLSFLDHHLRCGDSLFGLWVADGIAKVSDFGAPLFLHEPMTRAIRAASSMQIIEGLTDAEIAEAHRSADVFAEIRAMTAPLDALLRLLHAFDWLEINTRQDRVLLESFATGLYGEPIQIAMGAVDPRTTPNRSAATAAEAERFAQIVDQARELIADERFVNWQVTFPGVWSDWTTTGLSGGFDAVIGNPPWDRMKLEQVKWFAARRREISLTQRASDRLRMVRALETAGDPLAHDYAKASGRAETAVRIARASGDYPLLSGGDVNIYSLFVERALAIIKPDGMVGLLTPSGIASDKTAARFFKGISTSGRLKALYDFENRGFDRPLLFPDVHPQFKFSAFVASARPLDQAARCAFFLQNVADLDDPARSFLLSADDFAHLNPNTGTAPIFRSKRDADLTTDVYRRLPVLVDRSSGAEVKAWPVRYSRAFDMTNDSALFRNQRELEERERAYPIGANRYRSAAGEWFPLYEGKMIWHFDHRAASVVVNEANQYRPAYPAPTSPEDHANPDFVPTPQFWILATDRSVMDRYVLAFRDVTNPTDRRTFDACFIPHCYAGNTLPLIISDAGNNHEFAPLCANLNAIIFDYFTRQKVQKNHLNWYVVEQLPIVAQNTYESIRFGTKTAGDIVRESVLELTYTSNDMAKFARDMGYVDAHGNVKRPFIWDEERRRQLRARLDALFFQLYGVTDRNDVRYIYSTFGVIERDEVAAHGRYLSRDLCLAWINALGAGKPDAEIRL